MAPQQGGDARLQLGAEVAPPTENGELVFEAPWEARVSPWPITYAMPGLQLGRFSGSAIAEIAQGMPPTPRGEGYVYYERFQAALEVLLVSRGLVAPGALEAETTKLAARPHGHDH